MLFHLSIDADDPKHVAEVFAEMWGGVAAPFPPVGEGSWCAVAPDDRNSMIEVYVRGLDLYEVPGDADAVGVQGPLARRSSTHFAMATELGEDAVMAIARREGWPAKYRRRGDFFGVIEIWVEGWRMIEVLTPEMQREYLSTRLEEWQPALEMA